MKQRKKIHPIKIGNVLVGGGAPVRIQSMTKTHTRDVEATLKQIHQLEEAGCELIRVACSEERDVLALGKIKSKISIPLIADIHFNWRFALMAIEEGVDKLRLNPGNIGDKKQLTQIVEKAKRAKIPIRIGVNSGSLEKDLMEKYGPTPEALVESAKRHVKFFETLGFQDIILSLKASDVLTMVKAYRLANKSLRYPLHLGVTEAGTLRRGSIYSAVGIGILLEEGIGDTLRVSLTADPIEEVKVAKMILESLGLRKGPRVISCPSCGRAEVNVFKLAEEIENRAMKLRAPHIISVLGCVVNGPGEAHESDFGVTGGKEKGMIYINGKKERVAEEQKLVDELFKEIEKKDSKKTQALSSGRPSRRSRHGKK